MEDTTTMSNRYLMHYGVKGMKWGVRHDREKSLKKNRFKLSEKQKRYIKTGLIVAGASLALYGSYKLYKRSGHKPSDMLSYGLSNPLNETISQYSGKDITISKNTKMQRVSDSAFEDLKGKGETYVSFKFRDNQRYLSGFRKEVNRSGSKDFVHSLKPNHDLKIAGPETVSKTFLGLHPHSTDQSFRLATSPYSTPKGEFPSLEKTRDELFSALKKKGYHGYIDIEDASKVRNSKPLIIFDPDKYVSVKKSRKIGSFETFVANVLK